MTSAVHASILLAALALIAVAIAVTADARGLRREAIAAWSVAAALAASVVIVCVTGCATAADAGTRDAAGDVPDMRRPRPRPPIAAAGETP